MSTATLDEAALHEFVGRFLTDLAAAHHAATVVLGDRLGLYRALAERGPATPAEVADAANCNERYVREWLNAQAASGYCEFDAGTGRYHLTPAQEACLADDHAPTFLAAGMYLAAALFKDEPLVAWAGFCRNLPDVGPVFAGMTMAANDAVMPYNDRMPVLLARTAFCRPLGAKRAGPDGSVGHANWAMGACPALVVRATRSRRA